jgi:glycosyltransferase involved in cell wall biosynthesis
MGKVLFLIESLEYSGIARQMTQLAGGLVRAGHDVCVCVLEREGPLASELHRAGVPSEALGWSRLLHFGAVRRARRLVARFSPDLLHTWGLSPLRATVLLRGCCPCRVIASRPLPPGHPWISHSDRLLLGSVGRVVVLGDAEKRRIVAAGIAPEIVTAVPPAVEVEASVRKIDPSVAELPFVLCVGRMEPWKGFYDALWAFEMMYFVRQDLHLILVGSGPEKPRLERLSRGLRGRQNIHFLDTGADVPALIRRAVLVWVPSRQAGGVQVALETLAAGTPLVATGIPELAELLGPLGTDVLVPPGDKTGLVRRTRLLLDDAGRRRLVSERGLRLVEKQFSPEQLVRRFEGLYLERAG